MDILVLETGVNPCWVCPTGEGGVQFEYSSGSPIKDAEVEMHVDQSFDVYLNGVEYENISLEKVCREIEKYKQNLFK